MRTMDHSLHSWIVENLVMQCDPASLVATLVGLGISQSEAQEAVDYAPQHPYYNAALKIYIKLQKRDSLLKTLDFHQRLDPQYLQLESKELPPFKDFIRDYYSKNRPGLFRGAVSHWPAMQWTPRNLVDRIGADTTVQIQQGRDTTKDYEVDSSTLRRDARFGDFVDRIESSEHTATNDFYLTANNLAMKNGPFQTLFKDIGELGDGYLDDSLMNELMFLWLGPKGTITPLHHDLTNNVFIQIYGRKRFRLIPAIEVPYMYNEKRVFTPVDLFDPKPAEYPLYQNVHSFDITLDAGDFLFIPLGWWHHVVGETVSISLSFTNIKNLRNGFIDYPSRG